MVNVAELLERRRSVQRYRHGRVEVVVTEFEGSQRPAVGNLARCPRCDSRVHSSNGYRCRSCEPPEVVVRPCRNCGEEATSYSRFLCARCHFANWWGAWK